MGHAVVNWYFFDHVNYLLVTSVNWLIYFAVAEALVVLSRRLSPRKS